MTKMKNKDDIGQRLKAEKIGLQVRIENLLNKKDKIQEEIEKTIKKNPKLTQEQIEQVKIKLHELMNILEIDDNSETLLLYKRREMVSINTALEEANNKILEVNKKLK